MWSSEVRGWRGNGGVVGSGQGDAAAAAGAVSRTRPPPPLPALPAAASRLGLLASLCFPSPSPALQSAPLSPCHPATFQKSNTSSLSSSSCVRRALPRQYFIHEEPLRYDYQLHFLRWRNWNARGGLVTDAKSPVSWWWGQGSHPWLTTEFYLKTVGLVTCPRLWGGRRLGKMGLYSTRASISFLRGARIGVDEKPRSQTQTSPWSLPFVETCCHLSQE